jgi:hypothetical protein
MFGSPSKQKFLPFALALSLIAGQSLLFPLPFTASTSLAIARDLSRGTILDLNDLPPGFEVAPPLLQQFISRAIARSGSDLQKTNITLGEPAIFVDIENALMVTCVTLNLPDRTARENFDTRLRGDNGRAIFRSGFQQVLGFLGEAKPTEPKEIAALDRLGETARGYRMEAEVSNFPARIFADSLAFRRQGTGVLLIVGSIANVPEAVSIRDLALKLDRRLQTRSAK